MKRRWPIQEAWFLVIHVSFSLFVIVTTVGSRELFAVDPAVPLAIWTITIVLLSFVFREKNTKKGRGQVVADVVVRFLSMIGQSRADSDTAYQENIVFRHNMLDRCLAIGAILILVVIVSLFVLGGR